MGATDPMLLEQKFIWLLIPLDQETYLWRNVYRTVYLNIVMKLQSITVIGFLSVLVKRSDSSGNVAICFAS